MPFVQADPATGRKASAKCCTSDITLAEFRTLTAKMDGFNPNATNVADYQNGTPRWRTDLYSCLLYTSDAADERSSVDLGGRRIIKNKKNKKKQEKHKTITTEQRQRDEEDRNRGRRREWEKPSRRMQ